MDEWINGWVDGWKACEIKLILFTCQKKEEHTPQYQDEQNIPSLFGKNYHIICVYVYASKPPTWFLQLTVSKTKSTTAFWKNLDVSCLAMCCSLRSIF